MVQARPKRPLQRRVDGNEQSADPVGHPGRLGGQVIVESDENLQLGEGVVAGVDPSKRVRQGASGVGDDERVTGVGFGVAGVQVGQAAHGQAGQVGDLAAFGASHGNG